MKKTILLLSLCAILVSGCSREKEQKMREQHLKDSFSSLLNNKDQEVKTLFSQLNDIDESLNTVTTQYAALSKETNNINDISTNKANHIKQQINLINTILQQNKIKIQRINVLLSKNKALEKDNKMLKSYIDNLNVKITEQEQQITNLTKELQTKNIQIDNLNKNITQLTNDNKTKEAKISKIEDERYTGYFVVGTKKELMNYGLINNKGGFIGLGKTTILNNEIELGNMTKIDIRNVSEIPLTGKKITILTSHPSSSYSLEGGNKYPTSLKIINTNSFWQTSKCLIIMTK